MLSPTRKDTTTLMPRRGLLGASTLIFLVAACEDPQPPTACDPIPQQSVAVGETGTVTACFTDPNEDELSLAATSSDPGVATASLSGNIIAIEGVSPGNASVTVTATDPGGLEAEQSFSVMVFGVSDLLFTEVAPRSVSVSPGDTVDAVFTAMNGGSAASTETFVRFFQSADSTISTDDSELGVADMPALDPAQEVSLNVTMIFPADIPPGKLYVGACMDPVSGESDTTNNCSPGIEITVLPSSSQGARNAAPAGEHKAIVLLRAGSDGLIRVTWGRSR